MSKKAKRRKPKSKPRRGVAKTPKAKNRQSKIVNRKSKNVWHIFHFGERFELPAAMQACRDGPLQFVKLPVAGDPYDNESHILVEQLGMLDCQDNTLVLEAVFWRLVRQAGRRSRKYRGYLLNERYLPMTTTQISRVAGLGVKETARALKVLAKYNLIEQVAMPDFDRVPDEPESEKYPPQKGTKGTKSTKDQPQKGTKGTKSTKTNNKSSIENSKSQQTEADGAGGGGAKLAAPAASLDIDKLCDHSGGAFAEEVFETLFGRKADTRRKADRRELAAFAGCWNRAVLANLKPTRLNELWEKSVKMKPADKRRLMKADKPCAAWTSVFNGRLLGMTNGK